VVVLFPGSWSRRVCCIVLVDSSLVWFRGFVIGCVCRWILGKFALVCCRFKFV
ncbi:12191_t:CDS:1, partial [Gigaspora rosea]